MVGALIVRNPIDIWFDFVDPASVLLMLEVDAARRDGEPWATESGIRWMPLELRPPPTPLVGIGDPDLAPLWDEARKIATGLGVDLAPPTLVPWTRKAHELIAHSEAGDAPTAHAIRLAVARAYALEGRDIGRVDVLVEIAITQGLDRTETKAVLDVDRYEADVARMARRAVEARVTRTPTIIAGSQRLEGFHNRTALSTLLGT